MAMRSSERSHDDCGHDRRTSGECGEALSIFLDTRETASLLRISPVTLNRWRIEGKGPAYRKFGRRVLYARADLVTWSEAQRRQSTSQAARVPRSSGSAGLRSTQWRRDRFT